MLRTFVETGLRYRVMALALAGALLVIGAMRVRTAPVDTFPEFAPPMVEVQTEAPGLAATEVERLVTLPIEELLAGVSWLKSMRSDTVAGLSSVRLLFEPGTDLMRARQLVQERLTLSYTIPTTAKAPVMLQPLSSTSRVMMIGLSSKDLSLIQQSVIAQWTIKPKLLGVPGVANVAIWGERRRQLQVQVDADKLRGAGVKQEQIVSSAGDSLFVASLSFLKASNPGSGGWIDGPNQRLEIRHVLPISSAADLGKVSIDGSKRRLGEVASVVEDHPPMVGEALVNGIPGLILVVEKFPGASTVDVARRVEAALSSLRPGLPGLNIDNQLFNASSFVEEAFENNSLAILAGLVLLAAVLVLLLQSVRATIVALGSIILSVAAVLIVLNLAGVTINTVTLAGILLAVAVIVDEVVTTVENIQRRAASAGGANEASLIGTVTNAVVESRRTIGYALACLILLALPVYFIGGQSGALLRPMAISFMLAVVAAVAATILFTPALAYMLMTGGASHEPSRLGQLQASYRRVLEAIMDRPAAAYVGAAAFTIGAVAMWPMLNRSLLPQFEDRDLVIRVNAAPGVSHPGMTRITTTAVNELRAIPGVRTVSAHIGRAITGDQIVSMSSGQIWVSIDEAANYARTVDTIRATLAEYPGISFETESYLRDRIREALTGVASPVVVRIYGPDRQILAAKADEVRQLLSRVNGLVDLRIQGQITEPQLHVKVDLAAAAQHGLKPGDVRRAAATLFSGLEVGKIFEQQKVFDVVVWSSAATRANMSGLANMLVETPGGHVKLGDLAQLQVMPTPTVIRHDRASPYVDVTANVRGRDLSAVVRDVERRIADIRFPLEHHPEILGEFGERRVAQTRTLAIAIGAAIGIFLLFHALVGNWTHSMVSILAVCVSAAGGVIAAMIFGAEATVGTLAAFVGIFALAIRQVLVLIQQVQDRTAGGVALDARLMTDAAVDRVVPLLTSAAGVAAVLLPVLLLGNVSGFEIGRPMAIGLIGGLIASTAFMLLVFPALFVRFANSTSSNGTKGDL